MSEKKDTVMANHYTTYKVGACEKFCGLIVAVEDGRMVNGSFILTIRSRPDTVV